MPVAAADVRNRGARPGRAIVMLVGSLWHNQGDEPNTMGTGGCRIPWDIAPVWGNGLESH
jgi:hypothetical protein